jgi:sugar lactone lactonase YvrE
MSPTSLAADASGNIYVSDYEANVIRKIDPKGNVTTLAGTGQPGWKDGPGLEAQFNAPNGIAVGPDASVYVADALNHRIRKITSDGQVSTVAGGGPTGLGRGSFSDGPVDSARFNLPKGVAVAPDGTLYVADTDNLRIRRISEGVVSTFAGTGEHGSKDGDRSDATFSNVAGISISSDGSLFVADQPASLIRRIGPSGQVTTVARGLLFPAAAVAMAGGLLVADTGNQRVLQLDPQGAVVSQAGSGRQGFADANGSAAEFFNPTAVLLVGNHIYVADSDNHRIRTMEVLP